MDSSSFISFVYYVKIEIFVSVLSAVSQVVLQHAENSITYFVKKAAFLQEKGTCLFYMRPEGI
jgi:hypothetical protein